MQALLLQSLIMIPCLLRLSYTDIKTKELENIFIFIILSASFFTKQTYISRLIAALVPCIFVKLMGLGDILLFSVLGIVFGIRDLLFILTLSSLLAGTSSAIKLLLKKIGAKDTFPFAPYISISTLILLIKQAISLLIK